MDADKACGIKPRFKSIQGLAQKVRRLAHMQSGVVSGGSDPVDLIRKHKYDSRSLADRKPFRMAASGGMDTPFGGDTPLSMDDWFSMADPLGLGRVLGQKGL